MKVNPFCRFLLSQTILFLAFVTGILGCGGPNLATVNGTVTFKGDKVKGGMLIFSPVRAGTNTPGEPAAAAIQDDGSFVLKTGADEGALVGKSSITFSPPAGDASGDAPSSGVDSKGNPAVDYTKKSKPSPYVGLVPKDATVEIKPGANTFNVELIRGK